jgi:prevent-host-death family protein
MPQNSLIKTKTISATEAKLHLGQYLNQVCYGKQIIIIEKMGLEVAHIVPADLNQKIKRKKTEKEIWQQACGMWKNKKPDPIKLLKEMRKDDDQRSKNLKKLMANIYKRKNV